MAAPRWSGRTRWRRAARRVFQDGRLEGLLSYTSQRALDATQPIFLAAVRLATDYGAVAIRRCVVDVLALRGEVRPTTAAPVLFGQEIPPRT